MIEIETQRLKIVPMTKDELQKLINQYRSITPELSIAYQEMLDNCIKNPEQFIWFIPWKICLIENNQEIGYASFKGFNDGYPKIGYGINAKYQGNGFATESVKALCDWAIKMPGVIAIEAEVEISNTKSNNVLIKIGFVKNGTIGIEGHRYTLKKATV